MSNEGAENLNNKNDQELLDGVQEKNASAGCQADFLLIGAAGFIGSAVYRALSGVGTVSVLDNLSFGRRSNIDIPDERFLNVDILDAKGVAEAVRAVAPRWVIHLAALHYIPYCNAHPYEASNINLIGTLNVLDALVGVPSVEKVFFASTAAVYADSPTPTSETSTVGPMDIYGLTKYLGERLINEFHLKSGIPCVIGRLFNAYGPRETNPHLVPEIHRQIVEGNRKIQLGNIETRRDYIHVSDMSRAIVQLTQLKEEGVEVYNIGTGVSYTARDIVESFERAADCKLEITVASDRVRKQDRMLLQANIDKIKGRIGWEPKMELQQGIDDLVRNEA
jgi:UDP-glucose 4-epimerase